MGCGTKNDALKNNLVYNITDYGAIPDSSTVCTAAIQQAIDEAAAVGGTVLVPAGKFVTGTLILKSNVTLEVSTKGELIGSPNSSDYILVQKATNRPNRKVHHLIYANGQKNISIKGNGTINGNCYAFWTPQDTLPRWIKHGGDMSKRVYSNMVEMVNCEDIRIENITLKDSPEWTLHLFDCTRIFVTGIKIDNNLFGPNTDGLDLSGCKDAMIANCHIKTCDDAICIKTFNNSRNSENIVVTNCVLQTLCVALKLEESYKKSSNVTFSNCAIYGSSRAIGLYVFQGGIVENINISNIVSESNAPLVLNRPIHIGAWDNVGDGKKGTIRNVSISNFLSTTQGRILVTAAEGHTVENITMRDIRLIYPYIEDPQRYAVGITSAQLKGVSLAAKGARAAFVAENVRNLTVDNFDVSWNESDTIPAAWQLAEKIENGSDRVHRPDYSKVKQADFQLLWADKMNFLSFAANASATSSDKKLPKYTITNSSNTQTK